MNLNNKFYLAFQNISNEFSRTKISILWLPLTFCILILSKAFFLADILGKSSNYLIYLSIGVWVWQYISLSVISYGSSIYNNHILIDIKIEPLDILHITFLRMKIILFMNTLVLLIFLFFFDVETNYIYFLISLILLIFGTYHLGKLLSIISLYFRDVTLLINSFLIVVFFLSPIFWYPESLSDNKLEFLKYNPIFHILNIFRDSLMKNELNFVSLKILSLIALTLYLLNKILINKLINNSASKV